MSDEEIYQAIGAIICQYSNLKCKEGVTAVLKWLKENRIEGQLLRLKTRYREPFILSLRLERLGIGESITRNGVHYGVEVRGRVFDNLSGEGLPRDQWIRDFSSSTNEFLLEELENF